MKKSIYTSITMAAVFIVGTAISSISMAAVPAPPVVQNQGIPDGVFNNLQESDCRTCHNQNPPPGIPVDPTYLPNRHHLLVDTTIPPDSDRPNPDPDGDGVVNTLYECLSCHSLVWNPNTFMYELDPDFRDCLGCHQQTAEATVHHLTALAAAQDCKACHGGLIDNPNDGHYIPTYQPSLVTPWPSGKVNGDDTVPPNSAGTFAGNCNFCHNTANGQGGAPGQNQEPTQLGSIASVYQNHETHHGTGLALTDSTRCSWCHDLTQPSPAYAIRACEACHGVSSLHNITADTDGNGVTPGAELPGYSHTGAQSDCWGCHGNNGVIMSAPMSGPAIPSIASMSGSTVAAGADSTITLGGMNFTNYIRNPWTGAFDILVGSSVQLTDAAGNATLLSPSSITEDTIEVVIPAAMAAGNYNLTAKKGPSEGNPMNLTITPEISISSAVCDGGALTVTGSGFGTHLDASDSGTSVTMDGQAGDVTSWSDTQIQAGFTGCGSNATVNTVYDSASASVN
ncbi:MAG: IPT/TIG domain-containing protein [Candidatus Thiodiazotropha sp. (ex Dulcina madagascariensis)]|nr:IPT/TIG domain-containing protein [Candidatus Thiodiazotropha sp. (ex Dulcina madagascariensis)]